MFYWQLNWGQIAFFNNWDELSPFQNETNCRLGRIVAFWNLGRIVAWDESSLGTNCHFTLFTTFEAQEMQTETLPIISLVR